MRITAYQCLDNLIHPSLMPWFGCTPLKTVINVMLCHSAGKIPFYITVEQDLPPYPTRHNCPPVINSTHSPSLPDYYYLRYYYPAAACPGPAPSGGQPHCPLSTLSQRGGTGVLLTPGGGTASLRVGTQNKTIDPRFCTTTALSHCPCWFTAPCF